MAAKQNGWAVRDADGDLVGGHRWGGPSTNLIVTYADTGSRVFIPEADAIWYQGLRLRPRHDRDEPHVLRRRRTDAWSG